jgi:hypothetical protein
MTKLEKIAILEEVLRDLKLDHEFSKMFKFKLFTLSTIFMTHGYRITQFKEVMAFKPETLFARVTWFDRDPKNNQRIELIEKVLKKLKSK